MIATAPRHLVVVYPPPSDEPVEMPREVADLLIAQNQDILSQLREIHDKQTEHTHTLAEQDRQRAVMWRRLDEMAAVQDKELPLVEDAVERVVTIESTLKENIRGMELATRIRKFLLWVGGLTITGLLMAGTAALVGWLVAHWSELFRRG